MLAQIPGAEQAIQSAASEGWVAVLLVVIVLSIIASTIWTIRFIMMQNASREERMAKSIENGSLRMERLVEDNTRIMTKTTETQHELCHAIDRMDATMRGFNGDLHKLCLFMSDAWKEMETQKTG